MQRLFVLNHLTNLAISKLSKKITYIYWWQSPFQPENNLKDLRIDRTDFRHTRGTTGDCPKCQWVTTHSCYRENARSDLEQEPVYDLITWLLSLEPQIWHCSTIWYFGKVSKAWAPWARPAYDNCNASLFSYTLSRPDASFYTITELLLTPYRMLQLAMAHFISDPIRFKLYRNACQIGVVANTWTMTALAPVSNKTEPEAINPSDNAL